jgi:O-antigen/teichoic acid export membrane protein
LESKSGNPLPQLLKGQAKDALVFSGSTLANQLGSFFLLPLYWRKLTPDDYGVLAVVAIIGSFQRLFSNMALDFGVTRFFYAWPEADRRRNLGALWTWNWISTVLCCALFLLVLPYVSPLLFPDVRYDPYLMLGVISTATSNLFVIPATTIRIKRMPWLFATYNLVSFAATTGLGLWFLLVRNERLHGYMMSMIWANLLMALIGAVIMLAFSRPCLSSPGLAEAARFSFAAVPSNVVSTSSGMLDRFLLNYYASLHTLGLYAVSMRFAETVNSLHGSLKMTYGPFMMKSLADDAKQGPETVASVTPYYVIPYMAAGLCISLFIGPLIHVINKPDYFGVVEWVPWLTGVTVLGSLYFYYTNGMFLANRTELLFVPATVQVVMVLISGVWLIAAYQLPGLVASRYLSAGAFFAVSLYLSQKVFPFPHRWAQLIGLGAGAIGLSALGQLLTAVNPYVEALLRVPFAVAFAGLAYWLVRVSHRLGSGGARSEGVEP